MTDTCAKCRYWFSPPIPPAQWGQCRRRAPVLMLATTATEWPQVHREQWCGEFEFQPLTRAIEGAEDADD